MRLRVFLLLLPFATVVFAQKPAAIVPPVRTEGRKLTYVQDERGNRVPDYSYCGYAKSERAIPEVPVRIVVPLKSGDATARIQSALNYVSSLPLDASGFRGAVLLEKGTYEVQGGLHITASGVVLRGSGMGKSGTTLLASGLDRETLIRFYGSNDRTFSEPNPVVDKTVPVNALKLKVKNPTLKVGDNIRIQRPSTKEWIVATSTESFGGGISSLGWKPGNEDIFWDRTVTAISGDELTIDAPLTTELDEQFGGGQVYLQNWPGRIRNCGLENLNLTSTFDKTNPKDENHRWMAVTMENLENAWVRRVEFRHFAGSAVYTLETTKQITVEDCKSFEPVSEIGGYRRNTFFNEGQLNLFQRLCAEYGYHDFAVGQCAAGPNAFVQCFSYLPYSFSGALGSWASGVLYDIVNVDGNALSFKNRGQDGQGAGWSAANSTFWQCTAALIECPRPPTAQNWTFGVWSQFQGDGSWTSSNDNVSPRSLYYGQLSERLGKEVSWAKIMPSQGEASSSPSIEVAAALTQEAKHPPLLLTEWIDSMVQVSPLSDETKGIKTIDQVKVPVPESKTKVPDLKVVNGWLVRGNRLLTGNRRGIQWWNGNIKPNYIVGSTPHVTRWVPGRTGTGFTDDLQEMTDQMQQRGVVALDHNYGLWYERRRDDHERIRRMDGDVWAPFYELPFARSGKESAWDGLSKYDLTKWNYWYWNRLKTYADLADQKGLVLFHQNYFQHNIIEAGAHWADCPWRSANNVNSTGFPEPVNFAGDKRIFVAEQFYDISNPVRRALNRNYIRKCLDNFKDNSGVIQFIGAEFTGPLHFVNFWLDVISEWQKETGKEVIVALSTTKDVQDSVLADPVRSKLIDVIDTKYWEYEPGGNMYAPAGGKSLAPRQHLRLRTKGGNYPGNRPSEKASKATTPSELMYWSVRDYRDAYPDKAVIFSSETAQVGWPAFMGGGSICDLPRELPAEFFVAAATMRPMDAMDGEYYWLLGNPKTGYIAYTDSGTSLKMDLTGATGRFNAQWFSSRTGEKIGAVAKVETGSIFETKVPAGESAVLWLYH
jgi:hypothetical protein